jgi:hypothetical protein
VARDLLLEGVDDLVRPREGPARARIVGVVVVGARPDREELRVDTTAFEPRQIRVGPEPLGRGPPRKPRRQQVQPAPAIAWLPAVEPEIEAEVDDRCRDVVVAVDDDRVAV